MGARLHKVVDSIETFEQIQITIGRNFLRLSASSPNSDITIYDSVILKYNRRWSNLFYFTVGLDVNSFLREMAHDLIDHILVLGMHRRIIRRYQSYFYLLTKHLGPPFFEGETQLSARGASAANGYHWHDSLRQ